MSQNVSGFTNSGYLGQDKQLSSTDLSAMNNLYNSTGDSTSSSDQVSLSELSKSKSVIGRDLYNMLTSQDLGTLDGSDHTGGGFSAQAVHDMIYALNQDPNTPSEQVTKATSDPGDTGTSTAVIDAAKRTEGDQNAAFTQSDHHGVQQWLSDAG